MNRVILAMLACLAVVMSTLAFAAETPNKRESYESMYGPLSEHNIFSSVRPVVKTPPAASTSRPAAPPRTAEESLVLRGIALESDGAVRAYVEDVDTGKILKLAVGDSVGRGKVTAIDLEAVEYTRPSGPIWIEAGADFTGRQVIAIPGDITPSAGGGVPTTGPVEVINPNDPNLTMEQKLKLRRQHPELFK